MNLEKSFSIFTELLPKFTTQEEHCWILEATEEVEVTKWRLRT